jgi:hypothetical protein
MPTVTIENRSGFGANVTVGTQGPLLVPHNNSMTFDVTGQVVFQATPLAGAVGLIASVPWPYNPPREMAIALKVNNTTGQFFFDPSGSIQ